MHGQIPGPDAEHAAQGCLALFRAVQPRWHLSGVLEPSAAEGGAIQAARAAGSVTPLKRSQAPSDTSYKNMGSMPT